MQPIVVNEGRPPWVRWLAIPAALAIIVLVSLAVDTESRESFIDRVRVEEIQAERFNDEDATRVVFRSADGEVVEFSLDGGEPLGRGSDGEIRALTLQSDPDGNIAGLIVNDDGTFTPYEFGEDVSGKTRLVPDGNGGFTLIRSDGSQVRLDVTPDGVQAFDEQGNSVDLPRDSEGRLDLGDGLTARDSDLEIPESDDQRALPDNASDQRDGPGFFGGRNLLIVLLGLLALVGTIWWFVAMKPKFRLSEEAVPAPVAAFAAPSSRVSGWDAFEAYLAELEANPDPAQAIRLAYAYAEQGMGRLVARGQDQTPIEWCEQVAGNEPGLADPLRSLTNRYSAIRFADQVPAHSDRMQALDELRQLVRGALS